MGEGPFQDIIDFEVEKLLELQSGLDPDAVKVIVTRAVESAYYRGHTQGMLDEAF